MSTYFNVDWLDDDRLDMQEGVQLDQFGHPINTPDVENLMLDFLVEGDDILQLGETDAGTGDPYYYSIEGVTADDSTQLTGSELWSKSVAAGTLMTMDKYDKFKEENKKRSTIANISKSLNEIEMVHNLGGGKTRVIQSQTGKSGFANSGQSNQMLETHYGDVSRTVKGMTGDIKKSMLSYEGSVEALRNKHIDDTWALYSDWLAMDPEQGTDISPITASDEEVVEVIDENYTTDENEIVQEEVSFGDEGWVNASACQYVGGYMHNGLCYQGSYVISGDTMDTYNEILENINNCDVNTWVENNGMCGSADSGCPDGMIPMPGGPPGACIDESMG